MLKFKNQLKKKKIKMVKQRVLQKVKRNKKIRRIKKKKRKKKRIRASKRPLLLRQLPLELLVNLPNSR
jgi:hypothetical protein